MGAGAESARFCLSCRAENAFSARFCQHCGSSLEPTPRQRREGAAFLLNELETLQLLGAIPSDLYLRLRRRYLDMLGGASPEGAPRPAAVAERAVAGRRPPREPGAAATAPNDWLAEQQANLLLYLGAFLIAIAAIVFVAYSDQAIGDAGNMALLVVFTLLFLGAGLLCMRLFPRVRQAGVVFFGVGALMVPLNFLGAYVFFFSEEDLDPAALWLAGSLTSALFYGAVSLLGFGRWFPVPMVIAMLSGLGAVLLLADAPPEAYPGSYIALACVLAVPSMLPPGRLRETFGTAGGWAAHGVVPPATAAAVAIAGLASLEVDEPVVELATRWYLLPTFALAAGFYWAQAAWTRHAWPDVEPVLTVTALGVSGTAAVALVYALDVGLLWYGPAVAIVGWLYASGSEGFGPRWFGQRYLGWVALAAITVSWLFFEGEYADAPRHGAAVHFSAMGFYLLAARLSRSEVSMFDVPVPSLADGQIRLSPVPAVATLIYAVGLALGIGFYYVLAALPAGETAEASDLSLAFFGLSLGVAGAAVTMRWWWPAMQPHVYAVALGMSLFVLLASVEQEGQVALLLTLYAGVSLGLALWERAPLALSLPATYGFFAILAAWSHYQPNDGYLPLVVSGAGAAAFAGFLLLRRWSAVSGAETGLAWVRAAQLTAFAYLTLAPVVGWIRLSQLADPEGFVGSDSFEVTLLYQMAAASVFLLGVAVAIGAWLARRIDFALGASALGMIALLLYIGHFRPENVQAYTAPLGVYLLAGALLASRGRGLSDDLRSMIGPVEGLGAALIMGPSFLQSLDDGAWRYGVILLVEGLGFVAFALVQRRIWLLRVAVSFVVLNALHYLFFAGGPALPNWAILALAGIAVMAAGTAILFGRERWTERQNGLLAWWNREALASKAR